MSVSQVETNAHGGELESRVAGLEQMLSTLERTVVEQSERFEREQGLLASIVQSSDDGIVSVGLDARISSWNAAAEKLFGFNAREAIGQNLVDLLVPPELRERAASGVKGAFASTAAGHPLAVFHPEVPALRKDGGTVEVSVSVSGIYDPGGKLLGASAIVRDITGRKRAEREQALLAAIVSSTDDAIITLSPDLRMISWNRGAENLLGFKAAEAIGKPVTIFVAPEGHARAEQNIARLLTRARDHQLGIERVEPPLQKKDGTRVDASLVVAGIYDAQDRLVGLSGIITDISARKRAEREQALLASIVQSSDDAIFSVSPIEPLFPIMSWNKGAEKLFGFTAEEAIGRNINELFVLPEYQDHATRLMREDIVAFKQHPETVRHLEVPAKRKDGRSVEVSLAISGIYDNAGTLLGMSGIVRDITERKQAEREQALLASIVQSSDDAIITISPEARVLSWNKGAEKLFGFNAAEAVGQTQFDLVVLREDREVVLQLIQEDLPKFKTDSSFVRHIEWRLRRKDNTRVDVSLTASAVRDLAGNVTAISLIMRDITERKRAEREMALLASIVQSADAAIVSLSLDFEVQSWNAAAERLFGYAAKEAIGRRGPELFVPSSERERALAEYLRDVESLRRPGTGSRYFEEIAQRKDGTRFDVSLITSGIFDAEGQLTGVSMIARDTTEIKRAEREQRMLAAIVNASEDAIISATLDNGIVSWNGGAEKLFGISAKEALGRNILEFVPPEEHSRVSEALAELSRSRKPVSFRIHSKRKDGTLFDSWVNLFPTYDERGNISAFGAIGRDITEMVKLEREQALLATIVNASADAILSTSREDLVTSWNPAAEKVFGLSAKEVIGRGVESFLPPEEAAVAKAATKRVFETGEAIAWEQRIRQKDGTTLISLASLFPIRNAAGEVVEVAGIGHNITQLKQIEEELREAHEYTRGLIESSVDAMVIVDPDMRISDGNERLAQLTELPKKALFGSPFESHFTEPAKACAAIEKALADGFVTNVDLTLKTASGKEIPISFNASLFYRAGKVFGIFGVARDVTEQRAMERRLRAEREYSRSLVQSSPDALLVSDSTLTLTDVNGQALRLTSYAREELIGCKLPSLFTDPIRATEVIEKVREEGLARDIELLLMNKIAQPIPVSMNVSAFEGGDGPGRRIVAAVRDISETKRAQEANSLLASIVGASGDAIYSETTEMMITSWNPAAEKLFGYSAAEMLGRSAVLMTPLDARGELAQRIRRIGLNRKPEHYETVRLRKDGSPVDVAITHSPILDASGTMTALSVIVTDVTERKRMEAELTEARDAALEGARIKSEFLANMSHEIRTPLNSIIGMTGLLLETQLTEEQRDLANDVRDSGDILLNLINDILDFSKIAAGKLTFEEVDFNLTDAVEGAIELISDQVRRKGLELNLSVEPDVPRLLRGDPARLRQVLLNLLSNAVKFTERGEVAVEVSKLGENPHDVVVRFEVRDTGIGIPKDRQKLLFQTFTQVDASTARRYGGTGLGLSIAKKLVEAMQGTIAVTSKPGAGSTFWFTAQFAKQVDVNRPASERFASLAGHKILIVDDNVTSRHILERQTASWGMLPTSAPSAEEALATMRREIYEIALIDVMMPEVDGIELARRIKADPALAKTVLIFVSSTGPRVEFNARLSGLDYANWLMKPVPESLLYDALVKAIASLPGATAEAEPMAGEAAAAKEPPVGRTLDLGGGRKLKVLLAEDNPINQKLAKLQLTKLGFEVDAVENGRQAVEAVAQHPYDVIFMDCQMPEMDGYEATREIRQRESSGRHTMIVAMTAHALPGDREKCLAAGMDGYISKPVKLEALEATLTELFASKAQAATDTASGG